MSKEQMRSETIGYAILLVLIGTPLYFWTSRDYEARHKQEVQVARNCYDPVLLKYEYGEYVYRCRGGGTVTLRSDIEQLLKAE